MKDQDIVDEAYARFKKCEELEYENKQLWIDDLKFANGDSDNGYQWDDSMATQRNIDGKPTITINKVKTHNRQVTNAARQNKPMIKVVPVDNGADVETAEVFNGIIRHICTNSEADTAFDTAAEFAVDAGLGYWLITTDYESDDSFDQEIYINAVPNPLNVHLYDFYKADGSDAKAGFIFEYMSRDTFREKYPDEDDQGNNWGDQSKDDEIMVMSYYRLAETKDTLVALPEGGSRLLSELGEVPEGAKTREVKNKKIEYYLIGNKKILEKKEWLGKYIPIVRVVGSEVNIEGKVVRTSQTRTMKDSQRVYNYWSASAVEFVMLQGKQPYIATAESIEGYTKYWDNLNSSSIPYLPYNAKDKDTGEQLPMPRRQDPPIMAQAYIQGMQISSDDMQASSGQYDAQLGQNVNQQSGRALTSLQRKGDNATFHFIDNISRAIKFTGKILIDLIPKIYDTERVVRILGEDEKEETAQINPAQPQAVIKQRNPMTGEISRIYNPAVGRYDVNVVVGQNYGTKRQEAAEGMMMMAQADPAIWQTHGDLIAKAQDWPMAEEFAKRFEKIIPPKLLENKDEDQSQQPPQLPPEVQQKIQQDEMQIKQLDGVIQKMQAELESKEKEDALTQQKIEIDRFNAETNRLKAMPQQSPQKEQAPTIQDDPNMQYQMHMIDMRKREADAKKAENEALKSENEAMTPQIEQLQNTMQQVAQLLQGLDESIGTVAHLTKRAAMPRRTVLELDSNGMPIASTSNIVEEE